MPSLPLKGMRIVAVEQFGAGPYGSMFLADLGADVIKVENPGFGGDVSRHTGPFFLDDNDSEFFQTFNRNKRSLSLNLKAPEAKAVLHRLAADSDAVLNNLRGDQPAKLGLDYAALGKTNPRIVCAHLSAYGRNNEREDWPGYDYLMQAEAGFMHLTGEPDAPPARFGLSMVDFMTGATLALALLAAYIGALKHGEGGDVDVSLFDVALNQLSYPATWYLNNGHVTERLPRSAHPATVPSQLYRTADGWIFVMGMTPKFWANLCECLEQPELAERPEFIDVDARRANREQLTVELDGLFSQSPTAVWLEKLLGKVPAAPVYDLPQALDNPWLDSQQLVQQLAYGDRTLKLLANPIKIAGERLSGAVCPPLGSDTDELLSELGYSAKEIASLRDAGAV